MVKLADIPCEAERIDLKDLPHTCELRAISEKMKKASEGVSGGLIISFIMRDDRTFPQKYTAVSGAVLSRAMKKLGLKNTEDLSKSWFLYELTSMRIGKPRMIPIEKVS